MMRFLAAATLFIAILLVPASAFAQQYDPFKEICEKNPSASVCAERGSGNRLEGQDNVFVKVARIIGIVTGIAAVLIIMYGGFRYITSGGDSSKINTAKNTIIYALVGLVVVAFAQAIIWFVVDRL